MMPNHRIIALAIGTIALLMEGCVSFESKVFSATQAVPPSEDLPPLYAETGTASADEPPPVDLASVSLR